MMTATSKLYYQAEATRQAIIYSDYPHERMIRAYRKSINRCARRKAAMLAERERFIGWTGDTRQWSMPR